MHFMKHKIKKDSLGQLRIAKNQDPYATGQADFNDRWHLWLICAVALIGAVAAALLVDMPVGAGFGDYVLFAMIGAILGVACLFIVVMIFGLAFL